MGRRLTAMSILAALGLALGACSGDDDGKQTAEAPQATSLAATTTERTSTERLAGKAESKEDTAEPKKEKGSSESSGKQGGGVPARQVQATNDSPPEVTLAVIDAKSAYVKKTIVRRYAEPLDTLEKSCSEPRVQLAESALTASHDVQSQTGSKLSILDVLHEVVDDHPSGVCVPAFTAVATSHGAS